LSSCRYVDFPGIGTVDLNAPEHPSNDRKVLEVVMEQMFADPSILDTIASVASALHPDEGAGGSAHPAAPEAAERVLGESTVGMDSVMIVPPPTSAGKGMGASLPQPAEAATTIPAPSLVSMAEGVVG
jgi:hypothetical protein